MNNSNKIKVNASKRKFLKQMPIYVLGGLAVSTVGQNIFNMLFNRRGQSVVLQSDSLFTARDHQNSLSCGCANCKFEKSQII
jgi:hypothetical protein